MQNWTIDTGAGLAAIGFWLFVAAIVVTGMWYDIRKRETQQETLRRIVESGQTVDDALLDRLLSASTGGSARLARELTVWGIVVLATAPGLALLAWFVALQYPPAFYPILGASLLVGCVGVGLVIAARFARRNDHGGL